MFNNELKKVSIADLEEAIGKAVTKLVGTDYVCGINKLNLDIYGAEIELRLSEPSPLLDKTEAERETV